MATRWEDLEKRASAAPTLREAMHWLEEASRARRTVAIEGFWQTPAPFDSLGDRTGWGLRREENSRRS